MLAVCFCFALLPEVRWSPMSTLLFMVPVVGGLLYGSYKCAVRAVLLGQWGTWNYWKANELLRDTALAAELADFGWYERLSQYDDLQTGAREFHVQRLHPYLVWCATWLMVLNRLSVCLPGNKRMELQRLMVSIRAPWTLPLPTWIGWSVLAIGTVGLITAPYGWSHGAPWLLFLAIPAGYVAAAYAVNGWVSFGSYARLLALCEMLVYGPKEASKISDRAPSIADLFRRRKVPLPKV